MLASVLGVSGKVSNSRGQGLEAADILLVFWNALELHQIQSRNWLESNVLFALYGLPDEG